jgi:hypothetical protein
VADKKKRTERNEDLYQNTSMLAEHAILQMNFDLFSSLSFVVLLRAIKTSHRYMRWENAAWAENEVISFHMAINSYSKT